jgi:hypothetical protein
MNQGFLLAAYRSLAKISRSMKITRAMIISYLLVLVVLPPVFVMAAFFASPIQTARFFNFQIKSLNPQILGASTSKVKENNALGEYAAGILVSQAEATVKALRIVSPEIVSEICLPTEECTLPQFDQPQAAAIAPANLQASGFAYIKSGQSEVSVNFDKEYISPPVVTANVNLVGGIKITDVPQFAIYDLTAKGFKIKLAKVTRSNLQFSWIALAE